MPMQRFKGHKGWAGGVNVPLAWCLYSVLNVKVIVGFFNQEKALIEACSVITNLRQDLRLKL